MLILPENINTTNYSCIKNLIKIFIGQSIIRYYNLSLLGYLIPPLLESTKSTFQFL